MVLVNNREKGDLSAKTTTATDPATERLFKLPEFGEEVGESVGGDVIDGGIAVGEAGATGVGGAGGEDNGASVGEEVGMAETGEGGEAVGVAVGETIGEAVGDCAKADPAINAIRNTTAKLKYAIVIVFGEENPTTQAQIWLAQSATVGDGTRAAPFGEELRQWVTGREELRLCLEELHGGANYKF
ncbi:hypothetical protein E3N88_15200 [Mikania micrantha]|uniref:Uncharacterized protein n=1 Tax=Mikania micrantha TaxID=192012 RepID=A0A5N6NUQ8_9ASTR|nr:hypothetical protein E3N88_15200 [Mikania micrantha]